MKFLFWIALFTFLALMLRLLIGRRRIDPRPSAPGPRRIPVPLEQWGFMYRDKPDGSPWFTPSEPEPIVVTIVDVQDGWVRYHHGKTLGKEGGFNDHRETLDAFMRRYHPWPP